MRNATIDTGSSADHVSLHLQQMLDRFRQKLAERRSETSQSSVNLIVEGNRKDQGSGGVDNV
jgi:hypothetical protein